MSDRVSGKDLKVYGYVDCMDEEHLAGKVYESNVEGNKAGGRTILRRLDELENT